MECWDLFAFLGDVLVGYAFLGKAFECVLREIDEDTLLLVGINNTWRVGYWRWVSGLYCCEARLRSGCRQLVEQLRLRDGSRRWLAK